MGFLPADDARIRGTVSAVEKFLLKDCFVARYNTEERVKTAEAEIDSLLREKEEIEKWAVAGSA